MEPQRTLPLSAPDEFDPGPVMTMREVADKLGLHLTQVHRAEQSAMRKIREALSEPVEGGPTKEQA